jgi:hypothetical protein
MVQTSLSVVLKRVLIRITSSGSCAEVLGDDLVAHVHLQFRSSGGNTSLIPASDIVCVDSQRSPTIQGKANAFNVTTHLPWDIIVVQPSFANRIEFPAVIDMLTTWCQDVDVEIIGFNDIESKCENHMFDGPNEGCKHANKLTITKPRESKARASLVDRHLRRRKSSQILPNCSLRQHNTRHLEGSNHNDARHMNSSHNGMSLCHHILNLRSTQPQSALCCTRGVHIALTHR